MKFTKDSFVRNLAHGQLLVPFLSRFEGWDKTWDYHYEPKGEDDAWHPSGDCIPSPTDLYEKALGLKTYGPIGPTLQRTFQVGHFWHQLIQNVLVEDLHLAKPEAIELIGIKVWAEDDDWGTEVSAKLPTAKPYHWVRGAADVSPLELPKWSGLCDIKTMRSADFQACQKSGLLPPRFAQKYEAQINIYMDLHKQERALILGVNKDTSEFIEFEFECNPTLTASIYDKWKYVSDCLDAGEAPDPDEQFELSFQGPIG
jgi:hypothetical protein